jgi:hypothetical protein
MVHIAIDRLTAREVVIRSYMMNGGEWMGMSLAEALSEASNLKRRFEQLSGRARDSITYLEGEKPLENTQVLLDEAATVLRDLERMNARIHKTNAATVTESGLTLTEDLVRRERLRMQHKLLTSVADAASGGHHGGFFRRSSRTELKTMLAIPVTDLHKQADDIGKQIRVIDAMIQRAGWNTPLAD